MNFEVNKLGRSFRGVMAYLLHDKRTGDDQPVTAARVAWVKTRNLNAAAGPREATRIMIATAQNAEALKRAAGRSSSGRKSGAIRCCYNLSTNAGAFDKTCMAIAKMSVNWISNLSLGLSCFPLTREAENGQSPKNSHHQELVGREAK